MAKTESPTLKASELPSVTVFELRRVLVLDMQQREVVKFVDGDNADLLVSLAVQLAVVLADRLPRKFPSRPR